MTSYSEIWNRIDKCLTELDEVIASIGEEMYPNKNKSKEKVFDTRLVVQKADFKKLQDNYYNLEDLNSEIMCDIIDMYDE